jgi:hypothetical protein
MDPRPSASALVAACRRGICRLAVPGAALALYGLLVVQWHWGPRWAYFTILRLFAFEPFRFPFLDIHAVLAAAQCKRAGIDVYLWNPCDVLGRVHVYSPLWLRILPNFLDTSAATGVGLGLGLLFIGSLALACRPTTRGEALLMALTALSPMTVYALERANNDVVVFLLIVSGCGLLRTRRPTRFIGYGLYVIAGLLKYYPLVLLAMLLRERRREAVLAAALIFLLLLLLVGRSHTELGRALANIQQPSYFADSFAAVNLPCGAAAALALPARGAFAAALLAILVRLAVAWAGRSVSRLDRDPPDWSSFEADCLITGALLLIACFVVAQNVDYRGVYLLLVMPGLIKLRRARPQPEVRRFFSHTISAVLFVSWEESLRRIVRTTAAAIPSEGLRLGGEILFWLSREVVWWWLIAALAAMAFCYLRQLPLARAVKHRVAVGEAPRCRQRVS